MTPEVTDGTRFLVCASSGYFADDVKALCAKCTGPIVHRPWVDADMVKICTACGAAMIKADDAADVRLSERAFQEGALFVAKTKGTQ